MSGEVAAYQVWSRGRWETVEVAAVDGVPVVVTNVAAVLWRGEAKDELLLQQRDKPGEPLRGALEVPMGRWHAGEDPITVLRREVREETGLEVTAAEIGEAVHEAHPGRPFVASHPVVTTVGTGGAFPVLHLAYECFADGEPRPEPGETADPRWYPVDAVREMLAAPEQFTGPTYAILRTVLGQASASSRT